MCSKRPIVASLELRRWIRHVNRFVIFCGFIETSLSIFNGVGSPSRILRKSNQFTKQINQSHLVDRTRCCTAIRGSPTTTARHWAREMATLIRLRSRMNPRPRDPYSPKLEQSERMQTGACWPWNLSTLPKRVPLGRLAWRARTWAF